ncbi:MAG: RNA-binding S4 domain-containing protein [Granulosicoccus sp.]
MPPADDLGLVVLDREPVELYKILKFEGLASSGAEAKLIIDDGQVKVNGDVETRRRRKIMDQDLIEVSDLRLKVTVNRGG